MCVGRGCEGLRSEPPASRTFYFCLLYWSRPLCSISNARKLAMLRRFFQFLPDPTATLRIPLPPSFLQLPLLTCVTPPPPHSSGPIPLHERGLCAHLCGSEREEGNPERLTHLLFNSALLIYSSIVYTFLPRVQYSLNA